MRQLASVYSSVLVSLVLLLPVAAKSVQQNDSDRKSSPFSGLADYYHHKFYGRKTASGELLQKEKYTAAHRTLPFGTKVKVTNKRSGKSCVVTINDRGPYTPGKVIDLSHAAASHLGVLSAGTALVACEVVAEEAED